jgi:hypothetical protein
VSRLLQGDPTRTVQRGLLSWLENVWDVLMWRSEVHTRLKVAGPVDVKGLVDHIKKAPPAGRRALYMDVNTRAMVSSRLGGVGAELVLAALLSGIGYDSDNTESRMYRMMTETDPAAANEVNQEATRRFRGETSILRKLTSDPADKPFVRRWLEFRDEIMREGLPSDVAARREREATYDAYLAEAVEQLRAVAFGSATENRGLLIVGEPSYDVEYWHVESDEKLAGEYKERPWQGKLVSNDGVSPSKAMRELFANVDKWAFDCAEFVQVAHLYARWKTMGDAEFNVSAGSRVTIRVAYSPGVHPEVIYERESPDESMTRFEPDDTGGPKRSTKATVEWTSVDKLLEQAPVGSRVVWRSLLLPTTSDFYNENALKLGQDRYAAHGFPEAQVFSQSELEKALAAMSYRELHGEDAVPPPEWILLNRRKIFVRKIEHIVKP